MCVNDKGVINKTFGEYEVVTCTECENKRIIAPHHPIRTLTENYCVPDIKLWNFHEDNRIKPGTYYTLLLSNAEVQGGISPEFIEMNELVNTARFLKDRFFFGTKLTQELYQSAELFITEIAWIPRNE